MFGSVCGCCVCVAIVIFFFFNDTATTEIYTLSLHDALPICSHRVGLLLPLMGAALDVGEQECQRPGRRGSRRTCRQLDRKSTRLNSSHANISYAVFCLKKKKQQNITINLYIIQTAQT